MKHMFALLLVLGLFGCSGGEKEPVPAQQPVEAAPQEAKAAAPVAAQLQGAGTCFARHCTLHFAELATGDSESVSMTRCPVLEPGCGLRKGRLTAEGQAQIKALAARLQSETLQAVYGCPGCEDGPTHIVALHRADGTTTEHRVDPYNYEGVPGTLREASALIKSVTSALGGCTSSDLIVADPSCSEERAKDIPPAPTKP